MNRRRRPARAYAVACAVAALSVTSDAAARLVKYGLATVDLLAMGPGHTAIDAVTHDVRVVDDGATLTLTAGLDSLRSGIDLADERMKAALETGRCPTATLTVPRDAIRFPTSQAPTAGAVRANLRLHCRTREVTFHYAATRSGAMIDARGAMRLDMRDFGIDVPTLLGLRAEPYVTVRASFRARDER